MKIVSILLLVALLAAPALAARTGDPIDGNDRTNADVEDACEWFYNYPQCNWCWTQCYWAMVAEAYASGGISWQWGD